MRRAVIAAFGVAALALARPSCAQIGEARVPAHLRDLDSSWRRVSIRLVPSAHGQNPVAPSMSALTGSDQPKVYYTQGKTVEWVGRTFLVACRPPEKPINLAAMQGLDQPNEILNALLPAPKPDDPLEAALIPLDSIAGMESVQPFQLDQAIRDRAALSGPVATMAAILFPVFANAREKARETSSVSNLKQIAVATLMYSQDWDEVLPPMKDIFTAKRALMPYCKNEQIFTDPRTNEPYHVNVAASRKRLAAIEAPAQFALFYEATPARDGKRAVAFMDGHVKRLTEQEWQATRRKSGMP